MLFTDMSSNSSSSSSDEEDTSSGEENEDASNGGTTGVAFRLGYCCGFFIVTKFFLLDLVFQ
jgi:hypothetical protein